MPKETLYIVMPAYNEEANIETVVKLWYNVIDRLSDDSLLIKMAIANDGSKDSTLEKLEELVKDYPCLEPLDKPNSGHGATLMYLYDYAIKKGADYIFQTDSDGQTDYNEFFQMWENRKKYDLQIGHRRKREDGYSRKIVTKVLKAVVKITFGVNVTDANTPFRLMNVQSVIPVINMIPEDFFLSNVALSAISVKRNLKINWIPITFRPRQGGVNSINIKRIFKIGLKAIGDFYNINKSIRKDHR